MSSERQPEFVLRFPVLGWVMAIVFTFGGIAAAVVWGPEFLAGHEVEYPAKLKLLCSLLAIVGPGLLLMMCQEVRVYEQEIESHHLGFVRKMDRTTCRILKRTANGYILVDAKGVKVHIHNMMLGRQNIDDIIGRKWGKR